MRPDLADWLAMGLIVLMTGCGFYGGLGPIHSFSLKNKR